MTDNIIEHRNNIHLTVLAGAPKKEPVIDDEVLKKAKQEDKESTNSFDQPPPCNLYVGDTAITEDDIAKEMQYHPSSSPHQSRADAARALVTREVLKKEIEQLGITEKIDDTTKETEEEAAIRILLDHQLDSREPTKQDCIRYFEKNKLRFRTPTRIQARHILLAAPPDDTDARFEARDIAKDLIAQLKKNIHLFDDFVLRYSSCPSKNEGGHLGWLIPGQTTSEFDKQLFRLPEGFADFTIETRWGYHIVIVDEKQEGRLLTFREVHDKISEYLQVQLYQQEVQIYLRKLHYDYKVTGLEEIETLAAAQQSEL